MSASKVALPIYQAGGHAEPRFIAAQEAERAIARKVSALDFDLLVRYRNGRSRPLVSANAKTGVSLDFPAGATCDPTARCALVCYSLRSGAPHRWPKTIEKQYRNLRYIALVDPAQAIARLSKEFAARQRAFAKRGVALDFLRVNGSGDLFPALIPVVNGFAENNPHVAVWIVTRRFDLAALICTLPNIFVQLSIDATTPSILKQQAIALVRTRTRTYRSSLMTSPTDDSHGAAIVFHEKRTEGLPYTARTDCPVDAGKLPLGNVRGQGGTACSNCRKCFTVTTLARERRASVHLPVVDGVPSPQMKRLEMQRNTTALTNQHERGENGDVSKKL